MRAISVSLQGAITRRTSPAAPERPAGGGGVVVGTGAGSGAFNPKSSVGSTRAGVSEKHRHVVAVRRIRKTRRIPELRHLIARCVRRLRFGCGRLLLSADRVRETRDEACVAQRLALGLLAEHRRQLEIVLLVDRRLDRV
jgi:hypothetical protein